MRSVRGAKPLADGALGTEGRTTFDCHSASRRLRATHHSCLRSKPRLAVNACAAIVYKRAGGTRTPNPRFRRPMLYPIELRAHGPILCGSRRDEQADTRYLIEFDTLEKALLACVPMDVMAVRQTATIRDSITAYSTAVGPSSEFRKRRRLFIDMVSPSVNYNNLAHVILHRTCDGEAGPNWNPSHLTVFRSPPRRSLHLFCASLDTETVIQSCGSCRRS